MLIPINELPPEGAQFTLDDQSLWNLSIGTFGMDCSITSPLTAIITVIPSETGCLVRGRLTGTVRIPCNRCAESTSITLATDFDEFEPLLTGTQTDAEESRIIFKDGSPVLDLGALCWEEFALALPLVPLCRPDCKGICPACGVNLNSRGCSCAHDEPDPRLAALRDLKIR